MPGPRLELGWVAPRDFKLCPAHGPSATIEHQARKYESLPPAPSLARRHDLLMVFRVRGDSRGTEDADRIPVDRWTEGHRNRLDGKD